MHPPGSNALAPPDVTRVADLTGLDRLGVPIWQALRPLGKSLSCHLGKGLTDEASILSALGEARECHDCEAFVPVRERRTWSQLPHSERPPSIDSISRTPGTLSSNEFIDWTAVPSLDQGCFWIPSASIAIDFTAHTHPAIPCSTAGQATAATLARATRSALLELVERDAVARHQYRSFGETLMSAVDPASIEISWFQDLADKVRTIGMAIGVHRLPALCGIPAYEVTLLEPVNDGATCRFTCGWGADLCAADAIKAAALEAAQARAANIAGARDDIHLQGRQSPINLGWLVSSGRGRWDQGEVAAGNNASLSDEAAVIWIVAALQAAGHRHIGRIVTSALGAAFTTVKCFVPTLARVTSTKL